MPAWEDVFSARQKTLAQQRASDDQLLNLGSAVTDLPTHHVTQALLDRQPLRVTVVAVEEQALVDDKENIERATTAKSFVGGSATKCSRNLD